MDLATLQRQLLGLIKFRYEASPADDPYIQAVAASDHLAMVREIVLWWRAYGVERYCVFTARLLKRQGLFDDAVLSFVQTRTLSPFIEKLGPAFLDHCSSHPDPLVATLARFELALIRVRRGDPAEYVIAWDRNPYPLLDSLLADGGVEADTTPGAYEATVAARLPDLFEVTEIACAAQA
jgi:hypothetical protein